MDDLCYDKDRFPNLKEDQFDCLICLQVIKQPRECQECGSLFGQQCIQGWLKKSQTCPMRCPASKTQIEPLGKALNRMYMNLEIKCTYFEKCQKICTLSDIQDHERMCRIPNCKNYQFCNNKVKYNDIVCDIPCALFLQVEKSDDDYKNMYLEIQSFLVQNKFLPAVIDKIVKPATTFIPAIDKGNHEFRWSQNYKGSGIEVSNNNIDVILKESAYMFRTILSDTPFMGGIHYWEIIADERTDNELKIGISTKLDFNYNTAFCDYDFGYAFYGIGQLRSGSNSNGTAYGKRFKKEGVLGCCLNMIKGQFSFSIDGKFQGIAYESEALKQGPIYCAIALLHCAGCKVDSSKAIPSIFPL